MLSGYCFNTPPALNVPPDGIDYTGRMADDPRFARDLTADDCSRMDAANCIRLGYEREWMAYQGQPHLYDWTRLVRAVTVANQSNLAVVLATGYGHSLDEPKFQFGTEVNMVMAGNPALFRYSNLDDYLRYVRELVGALPTSFLPPAIETSNELGIFSNPVPSRAERVETWVRTVAAIQHTRTTAVLVGALEPQAPTWENHDEQLVETLAETAYATNSTLSLHICAKTAADVARQVERLESIMRGVPWAITELQMIADQTQPPIRHQREIDVALAWLSTRRNLILTTVYAWHDWSRDPRGFDWFRTDEPEYWQEKHGVSGVPAITGGGTP